MIGVKYWHAKSYTWGKKIPTKKELVALCKNGPTYGGGLPKFAVERAKGGYRIYVRSMRPYVMVWIVDVSFANGTVMFSSVPTIGAFLSMGAIASFGVVVSVVFSVAFVAVLSGNAEAKEGFFVISILFVLFSISVSLLAISMIKRFVLNKSEYAAQVTEEVCSLLNIKTRTDPNADRG